MFIVFKMKHTTGPRSICFSIATPPYYNVETIVSMEHEICFTIVVATLPYYNVETIVSMEQGTSFTTVN